MIQSAEGALRCPPNFQSLESVGDYMMTGLCIELKVVVRLNPSSRRSLFPLLLLQIRHLFTDHVLKKGLFTLMSLHPAIRQWLTDGSRR
jgi:hypothetical protein